MLGRAVAGSEVEIDFRSLDPADPQALWHPFVALVIPRTNGALAPAAGVGTFFNRRGPFERSKVSFAGGDGRAQQFGKTQAGIGAVRELRLPLGDLLERRANALLQFQLGGVIDYLHIEQETDEY